MDTSPPVDSSISLESAILKRDKIAWNLILQNFGSVMYDYMTTLITGSLLTLSRRSMFHIATINTPYKTNTTNPLSQTNQRFMSRYTNTNSSYRLNSHLISLSMIMTPVSLLTMTVLLTCMIASQTATSILHRRINYIRVQSQIYILELWTRWQYKLTNSLRTI